MPLTPEQLIEKFNPANAGNLTPEDLQTMQGLTNAELKVLAEAYPNEPARKAYILLYDKNVPKEKQLYAPSTWQNLYNVRQFQAMKNLIPWAFSATALPNLRRAARAQAKRVVIPPPPARRTVDLSPQEAAAELAKVIAANAGESEQDLPVAGFNASLPADAEKETQATETQQAAPGTTPEQPRAAGGRFAKKTTQQAPGTTPADQQIQQID